MLLIAGHERRFSVEVDGADTGDPLTAREALRIASLAGDGARLRVDGLPLRPGGLATVEALASRRV